MKQDKITFLAVFTVVLSFMLVFLAWPVLTSAAPLQILITIAIGSAAGLTIILLDRRSRKHGNIERGYV